MTLDAFVQTGWAEHGDDAEGVWARMPGGVDLVSEAKQAPVLAALIVHVGGEHLGRWSEALALLDRLAARDDVADGSPAHKALSRSMAILHLGANDTDAFEACLGRGTTGGDVRPESDRIRVLAIAASALAGQKRTDEAIARLEEALALAAYGPAKGDPAAGALAVTGNNLACELEERPGRTAGETELMKIAARTGRRFWEVAGTWKNVERAEYRLAMTHLAAGEPTVALEHAVLCLSICDANEADAGERFFAHEALAKAHHATGGATAAATARDSAAACLSTMEDAGLRAYCEGELSKLDAALAAAS